MEWCRLGHFQLLTAEWLQCCFVCGSGVCLVNAQFYSFKRFRSVLLISENVATVILTDAAIVIGLSVAFVCARYIEVLSYLAKLVRDIVHGSPCSCITLTTKG